MLLSKVSRSLARVAVTAPRAATHLAAGVRAAPLLPLRTARMLSDGMHDDFKPQQKRSYANEAGDVHAQIKADIEKHKVVVYMKGVPDAPQCGFSNAVVQVMKAENVQFEAFNVLADPDLREGIKSFSNWPTIPQVYVDGEFIGGCDITIEMYKSGELKTILEEAGAK
jgi:monothiol glutaredoxin